MKPDRPQMWVKQSEWKGNPDLGLTSYCKYFKNTHTGRLVPVYVYGSDTAISSTDDESTWTCPANYWGNFCVSAGANSEYSYSGFIPNSITAEEAMAGVDKLQAEGKLFH